ncbi:MAG: succinate dehydrogenase, cytochrome b556 subunit [Steroidobacteraceae bacterium]|nr:succinate dehydrogenase, cytochrome b556 subunit [Steroidobacteraceae bacterium]
MQAPAPAKAPPPPVTRADRPLSPHLQVYRLALTTVLSGLHRISGLVLTLSAPLLVAWLVAAARGAEAYASVTAILGSRPMRIVLAGLIAAFWYHLFNGLRHLAWDLGVGFELRAARASGAAVILLAAAAFAATLFLTPAWRWLLGQP